MADLTEIAERLAPCPFCGNAPHHGLTKVKHCQLHGDSYQDYRIWCPKGHAQVECASRDYATAEWNRRVPDLTQVAREAKAEGLEEAAANCEARRSAELIMRDNARHADDYGGATMHGDRAQVLAEQTVAMTSPDEILSRLSEIEAGEAKATKGPWRSMREGNQYIGVELNPRLGRSAAGPRASKLVGASRIEGIERPWNPWWVGDPYSPKTEETVRLTDEDADFVAASRSDIPWLVSTVRALVAKGERDQHHIDEFMGSLSASTLREVQLQAQLATQPRPITAEELAEALVGADRGNSPVTTDDLGFANRILRHLGPVSAPPRALSPEERNRLAGIAYKAWSDCNKDSKDSFPAVIDALAAEWGKAG